LPRDPFDEAEARFVRRLRPPLSQPLDVPPHPSQPISVRLG
jgi:hypothetical protein